MKYSLLLVALLGASVCSATDIVKEQKTVTQQAPQGKVTEEVQKVEIVNPEVFVSKQEVQQPKQVTAHNDNTLEKDSTMRISVTGQGVAPMNTASPAQAYALAKRAAVADAYRLIAEKVKGVRIDGEDLIKNMMVKRSTVRTQVKAMVRNANIVETTFKDGLCEVEMEITLSHADFAQ